jgi:hypothetical protein
MLSCISDKLWFSSTTTRTFVVGVASGVEVDVLVAVELLGAGEVLLAVEVAGEEEVAGAVEVLEAVEVRGAVEVAVAAVEVAGALDVVATGAVEVAGEVGLGVGVGLRCLVPRGELTVLAPTASVVRRWKLSATAVVADTASTHTSRMRTTREEVRISLTTLQTRGGRFV